MSPSKFPFAVLCNEAGTATDCHRTYLDSKYKVQEESTKLRVISLLHFPLPSTLPNTGMNPWKFLNKGVCEREKE